MLALTHLIVSLLLINLLTLDRNDSFVALLFGVVIDVDHLFGLKEYVDVHGAGSVLDLNSLMSADGQWKSLLHNPMAAMVVGPVAVGSRLALPLVFWGVHVTMDYAEDSVLGLFSVWEISLLVASTAALIMLCFRRFRMANPEEGLPSFVRVALSRFASPLRSVFSAVSGPRGP